MDISPKRLTRAAAFGCLALVGTSAVPAQAQNISQLSTTPKGDNVTLSQNDSEIGSLPLSTRPLQPLLQVTVDNAAPAQVSPDQMIAEFNHSVEQNLAAVSPDMKALDKQVQEYEQRYPITVAVNRYEMEHHIAKRYHIKATPHTGVDKVDVAAATANGVGDGVILTESLHAISLGNQAAALGQAAVAAENTAMQLGAEAQQLAAEAQAAAAAGNLQQAAALAAQAQAAGNQAAAAGVQAQNLGTHAMKLGSKAQAAGQVAKVMTVTTGGIAVAEGTRDLYLGVDGLHQTKDLKRVAKQRLEEIHKSADGSISLDDAVRVADADQDYRAVTKQLDAMHKHAKGHLWKGGAGVGCGSLVITSGLVSGPTAPIAMGAVGGGCLITKTIIEYHKPIGHAFKVVGKFIIGMPAHAAPHQPVPPIR